MTLPTASETASARSPIRRPSAPWAAAKARSVRRRRPTDSATATSSPATSGTGWRTGRPAAASRSVSVIAFRLTGHLRRLAFFDDDHVPLAPLHDALHVGDLVPGNEHEALEAGAGALVLLQRQRQRGVAADPAALADERRRLAGLPAADDRLVDAPPVDLARGDASRVGVVLVVGGGAHAATMAWARSCDARV